MPTSHGTYTSYVNHKCRCDSCKEANKEYIRTRKEKASKELQDPLDPRHGNPSTYTNLGCRCDKCKASVVESKNKRRDREREALQNPDDPRHGTLNAYTNLGCRCDKCREAKTNKHRNYKYGVESDWYQDTWNAQNGLCAVCGQPEDTRKGTLAVDHCHTTGEVRELLCFKCNVALGQVKDSTETLLAMVAYLEKHQK